MNLACSGRRSDRFVLHDNPDIETIAPDDPDMVVPMIRFVLENQVERQRSHLGKNQLSALRRTVADQAVRESPAIAASQYPTPQPCPVAILPASIIGIGRGRIGHDDPCRNESDGESVPWLASGLRH